MLQAQQNQAKEPFLPQISKSFLRIKDGGMTIRLVIKYLVNKLKLESESEVEIRCRGQQVLPFLTLQHVRDSIWSPSDVVTLLPDSSPTDHLMVLHYGRSA
ncbi:protein LAX PANICLE 2-like [Coffea arabica]